MTKPIVSFRNFANMSKKGYVGNVIFLCLCSNNETKTGLVKIVTVVEQTDRVTWRRKILNVHYIDKFFGLFDFFIF
jgi:hypothetical protein